MTTTATAAPFMVSVLRVYDAADAHDLLFWRVEGETVRFYATCNDTFWWATADAEEVTETNLPVLEEAFSDLNKNDSTPMFYLSELFAARVRGMRPQRPCYKTMPPEIAALFDACGPERDPKDED